MLKLFRSKKKKSSSPPPSENIEPEQDLAALLVQAHQKGQSMLAQVGINPDPRHFDVFGNFDSLKVIQHDAGTDADAARTDAVAAGPPDAVAAGPPDGDVAGPPDAVAAGTDADAAGPPDAVAAGPPDAVAARTDADMAGPPVIKNKTTRPPPSPPSGAAGQPPINTKHKASPGAQNQASPGAQNQASPGAQNQASPGAQNHITRNKQKKSINELQAPSDNQLTEPIIKVLPAAQKITADIVGISAKPVNTHNTLGRNTSNSLDATSVMPKSSTSSSHKPYPNEEQHEVEQETAINTGMGANTPNTQQQKTKMKEEAMAIREELQKLKSDLLKASGNNEIILEPDKKYTANNVEKTGQEWIEYIQKLTNDYTELSRKIGDMLIPNTNKKKTKKKYVRAMSENQSEISAEASAATSPKSEEKQSVRSLIANRQQTPRHMPGKARKPTVNVVGSQRSVGNLNLSSNAYKLGIATMKKKYKLNENKIAELVRANIEITELEKQIRVLVSSLKPYLKDISNDTQQLEIDNKTQTIGEWKQYFIDLRNKYKTQKELLPSNETQIEELQNENERIIIELDNIQSH